ncbi:innexin inx2 [Folsomia candida]|uniref:innexin inx2 n=1 Tax=Folsomia candida TaxID=158441 RepID=UPI000B8FBE4C|nr:innexin inx2 [Folsomia candida]
MSEAANILWKLKGVFPSRSSSRENQQLYKTLLTNSVFRLHSHVTFIFLVLSSGLVFVQQLLGTHIKCLLPGLQDDDDADLRTSAVTTYCFITGTYTVPDLDSNQLYAHHGVGTHIEGQTTQKFHHYFQWVPFILLFLGVIFRLPYLLWRFWEKQKLQSFLNIGQNEQDSKPSSKNPSAEHFVRCLGYNKGHALSYLFSELLNFLLVLGSFWTIDWFLQGQFRRLGWEFFQYWRNSASSNRKEVSPLDIIFPKVSKCDFQMFGPSGNIVKLDLMCILACNIISEKIFLGLWAWLLLLFSLGTILLVYRSFYVAFHTARVYLILNRTMKKHHPQIKYICSKIGYADWFFLKRISDYLDAESFGEFCEHVQNEYKKAQINRSTMHHRQSEETEEMVVFRSDKSGFARKRKPIYATPQLDVSDSRSLYELRAVHEETNSLKMTNPNNGSLTQITVHSNDEIDNTLRRANAGNLYT